MFFFLFVFVSLVSLLSNRGTNGYISRLWGGADKYQQGTEGCGWVTECLMENVLLPLKEGLCHVCISFREVYDCVIQNDYLEEKFVTRPLSYLEWIMEMLGMYARETTIAPTCSYYSILVVTISTLLFILLLVAVKKAVDYFREEQKIFTDTVGDYRKKCPCFNKDQI
ncbi:hypothetical protein GWI33_020730 [Rhynchophorus ferrugineus]|uniref:Uncharacterized protein n=1 Tax=Rhynchophorus ferrugineus TaxID=354439 RepID=A0A834HR78_RHYFE|nr:hypothetical protein GWI33_020730 [Rhynchophorus ferrugineus]